VVVRLTNVDFRSCATLPGRCPCMRRSACSSLSRVWQGSVADFPRKAPSFGRSETRPFPKEHSAITYAACADVTFQSPWRLNEHESSAFSSAQIQVMQMSSGMAVIPGSGLPSCTNLSSIRRMYRPTIGFGALGVWELCLTRSLWILSSIETISQRCSWMIITSIDLLHILDSDNSGWMVQLLLQTFECDV
jgi:hypothetical protein